MPSILAATDLAVNVPPRPASCSASRDALQLVEPEPGLALFTVSLHFSWRQAQDPGHRGMRERTASMRLDATPSRLRR